MAPLRIAFLGGRILGYRCLELLQSFREQHPDMIDVRFVIPHTEEGKFSAHWNAELKPLARRCGIEIYEPATLKDPAAWQRFRDEGVNLLLNAFCNRIIPKEILTFPSLQAINFHYGKLPEYQGRFIVSRIILNNEKETRATVHFIEETVDGVTLSWRK